MKKSTPCVRAYWGRAAAAAIALSIGSASTLAVAQTPVAATSAVTPLQALAWDQSDARALLGTVARSQKEGLSPSNYGYEALKLAVETDDKVSIDYLATAAAIQLATDYRYGRAPEAVRVDWHMGGGRNPAAMMQFVAQALANHRVGEAIDGLLPNSPEYRKLRDALSDASDDSTQAQAIKVNMDRWRWMPRALGQDHVFVNIPAHNVQIVKGGALVAQHDAIVGAPATPTPVLMSEISAVSLNPTWTVPPLLKAEKLAYVQKNPAAARRMGYTLVSSPDGVRVVQAPGPTNALGKVKVVMPNDQAIYLHDTSNRKLFARDARNLSHGCIRVDRPEEMVAELLDGSSWDQARIDETLAGGKTTNARLAAPIPVYITYLTATVGDDGQLKMLGDPYKRDAAVAAALGARTEIAMPATGGARVQVAALD